MAENMRIFEKVSVTPDNARSAITSGTYTGMTAINPMYRIKLLTETFGPVGFGWYPEIISTKFVNCASGNHALHMQIALYVKLDDEWSKPIYGFGGTRLTNDFLEDAYKSAFTDALGNAAKLLGFGADVYWSEVNSKYMPAEDADIVSINDMMLDGQTDGATDVVVSQGFMGDTAETVTPLTVSSQKNPTLPHNATITPAQGTPVQTSAGQPQATAPNASSNSASSMPKQQPTMPLPQTQDEARALIVPFGVHKGKTLGDILLSDRGSLVWISENITSPKYAHIVAGAKLLL
ncbi:MAG: hypothetical protein ACI3V2_10905 [Faecousia sp.]